jgi:hypothetical protein
MARTSAVPVALVVAAVAAALPLRVAAGEPDVSLPKDFRNWTHVRSMVVTDPDEGMYGFHNVYANAAAVKVLRSARAPVTYPDGATFVVSIFEVKQEKGTVVAGEKQRDVVQVKDSRAKATGGWRYATFEPSGKRRTVDAAGCAACHAHAASTDMVFTRLAP